MRKLRRRRKPQGYSPEQIVKMFGVGYDKVLTWLRTKVVRASVRNEHRQWAPVLFSREDLLEVLLVAKLRKVHLGMTTIKAALRTLRRVRVWDGHYILISAERVQVARSVSAENQTLTIAVSLDKLREELGEKLAELETAKEAAVRAEHRHEHSSVA